MVMNKPIFTITLYRNYSIKMNPSGMLVGAMTDTFAISKLGAHPKANVLLYEHPKAKVKKYLTESSAREAALKLAKSWVDEQIG